MIPTRVKEYRNATGYSQQKLAQISGIPQTTLSGWETGLSGNHAITRALILAKIFSTTVEDLFGAATPDDTKEPYDATQNR